MRIAALSVALCFLTGCGGADLDPIEPGSYEAQTLIIFDGGYQIELGEHMGAANGAFVPAGPSVIFVVRRVPDQSADRFRKDGLKISPHTAYRLQAGEPVDLTALKSMKPIGTVDAALSGDDVIRLFMPRQPALGVGAPVSEIEALDAVVQAIEDDLFVTKEMFAEMSPDDPDYSAMQARILAQQAELDVAVARAAAAATKTQSDETP